MPQRMARHPLLDPRRPCRALDRLVVDLPMQVMTPSHSRTRGPPKSASPETTRTTRKSPPPGGTSAPRHPADTPRPVPPPGRPATPPAPARSVSPSPPAGSAAAPSPDPCRPCPGAPSPSRAPRPHPGFAAAPVPKAASPRHIAAGPPTRSARSLVVLLQQLLEKPMRLLLRKHHRHPRPRLPQFHLETPAPPPRSTCLKKCASAFSACFWVE